MARCGSRPFRKNHWEGGGGGGGGGGVVRN